ncbi:MAG TPA: hypothetical protein V6D10_20425 [Trichocoleus sp.]|jgi:hypothetical protein
MNLILLIGAIVISFLVFGFVLKVMRAAVGTAIGIALIVLVLQLIFGIAPNELWAEIRGFWESLLRLLPGR